MKEKNVTTNTVNIHDFPTTQDGITAFREKIREQLGIQLFEYKSMDELTFAVLQIIEPVCKEVDSIKQNSKGIEAVLKYFKILKSRQTVVTSSIPGRSPKNTNYDNFNFNFYILGLREVPYFEILELKPQVESDLHLINDLILKYEECEDIKQFRKDNQINKKSSIPIIHFYWRCIDARQEILNYYFKGMFDWAIRLSSHYMEKNKTLYMVSTMGYRPYEFNKNLLGPNFDFWNIDCASHRLNNFDNIYVYETPEYLELYKSDKKAFYDKIFELRSKDEIVSDIFENMEYVSNDRKVIFEQMLTYFKNKEWLAFYSIALPQIEGLFSEMIEAESLDNNSNSLSTKARSLRMSSYIDIRALDYYEYILPAQRNSFAHGGILGDVELLSYDLITDLECLLFQFSEMENPFIKAARLVRPNTTLQIDDIYSLGEFFKIILGLKPNQEKRLHDNIVLVNNNLIIPNEENYKEMFRLHGAKFDFGKKDFNDELGRLDFGELDNINDLIKELGKQEVIEEFKREFLGFILETESFLEILEYTRKYCKKYLKDSFLENALMEYGVQEKKAMNHIKKLSLYRKP